MYFLPSSNKIFLSIRFLSFLTHIFLLPVLFILFYIWQFCFKQMVWKFENLVYFKNKHRSDFSCCDYNYLNMLTFNLFKNQDAKVTVFRINRNWRPAFISWPVFRKWSWKRVKRKRSLWWLLNQASELWV